MRQNKLSGQGTTLRTLLAILFGLMIALYMAVFTLLYGDYTNVILSVLIGSMFVSSIISVFVMSIVHLVRYKEKGLAVTALVFASLFIFFCMGLLGG